MIAEGKPFPGPLELIEHHKTTIDGFVTKPTKACNRAKFQPAIAFRGMTYTDLENELLKKAEKMKVCSILCVYMCYQNLTEIWSKVRTSMKIKYMYQYKSISTKYYHFENSIDSILIKVKVQINLVAAYIQVTINVCLLHLW